MELCSDNLKIIIQQKSKYFMRDESKPMNTIEYFISCQLFKVLLECVQYLHEGNPQIIHKDLKPENILVSINSGNNRFLKLADFGLAIPIDTNTITLGHNSGTYRYMPPEAYKGRDGKCILNTKYYIYSLSIISQDLFEFDINSSDNKITGNENLNTKWNELQKQINRMFSTIYRMRPNCADLLSVYNEWAIDSTELKNSEQYHNYKLTEVENNQQNFFVKLLNVKLNC